MAFLADWQPRVGVSHGLAVKVQGYHSGKNSLTPLSWDSLLGLGEGKGKGEEKGGQMGRMCERRRKGKGRGRQERKRGKSKVLVVYAAALLLLPTWMGQSPALGTCVCTA